MRVKTDLRRNAITRTAWALFKEKGFERASMSEISARLGGSKATLYGYFRSKEELFFAAIEDALTDQVEMEFDDSARRPLPQKLTRVAEAYLKTRLSDDGVALERIVISEAARSGFGVTMLDRFLNPKRARLTSLIEEEMSAGRLHRADPDRAALAFFALVQADLLERRLYGAGEITATMIRKAAAEGVEIFLRAYAVA